MDLEDYRVVIQSRGDNPDQMMVEHGIGFTKAEYYLRQDLLSNKVVWRNQFASDFKFYVRNKHSLIGILCVHPLHPYTAMERLSVEFINASIVLAVMLPTVVRDRDTSLSSAPLLVAVCLVFSNYVLKTVATCQCAQVFDDEMRLALEGLGEIVIIVAAVLSVVLLIVTINAAWLHGNTPMWKVMCFFVFVFVWKWTIKVVVLCITFTLLRLRDLKEDRYESKYWIHFAEWQECQQTLTSPEQPHVRQPLKSDATNTTKDTNNVTENKAQIHTDPETTNAPHVDN